ncbi:PH domain-containing protein [Gephyromycinifex aptenodytis]|uniref:PH domain-containing protein n=1 Tax=Gephyromycinifex aptenodytis TaxID=2716227 RepID=UPI001B2FEBBC|nr:PH domain-containing protein [Gephyromycinifex aptenodytis]
MSAVDQQGGAGPGRETPPPPESWPGAGGQRSVAPPVPAWPGSPTAGSDGPGGSWPGAVALNQPLEAEWRRPQHHVSPKAKQVWRLSAGLGWLIPVAAVVAAIVFLPEQRTIAWWVLGAFLLLAALHIGLMPIYRYRVHRWEVTAEAVYTQSGWVSQERRIAPISRIQTVDSEFGPIERLFGLGTLTVTTASAAGALRVAGLEKATVNRLVEDLTRVTSAVRGDAT